MQESTEYRWSLGTLVGFPLAVLGCLVLAGLLWLGWRWVRNADRGPYGEFGMAVTAFVVGALSLVTAIASIAWGMWPYDSEYHQWRNVSGEVQSIDSRLFTASGDRGPTQRFVVTFTDGQQRSCDDTRCAQVDEGDELTLACKRAWQWSGTHGYDCNYVSHEVTR